MAINFDGFFVSMVKTLAKKPSCFFSISIWILLADIKAISIPEKKAENSRDSTIIRIEVSKISSGYPVFVVRIFFDSFF